MIKAAAGSVMIQVMARKYECAQSEVHNAHI